MSRSNVPEPREILRCFLNSVDRLDEILREPKTVANRDSAIKRFELTFELAWKSLQRMLRKEGIVCVVLRGNVSGRPSRLAYSVTTRAGCR